MPLLHPPPPPPPIPSPFSQTLHLLFPAPPHLELAAEQWGPEEFPEGRGVDVGGIVYEEGKDEEGKAGEEKSGNGEEHKGGDMNLNEEEGKKDSGEQANTAMEAEGPTKDNGLHSPTLAPLLSPKPVDGSSTPPILSSEAINTTTPLHLGQSSNPNPSEKDQTAMEIDHPIDPNEPTTSSLNPVDIEQPSSKRDDGEVEEISVSSSGGGDEKEAEGSAGADGAEMDGRQEEQAATDAKGHEEERNDPASFAGDIRSSAPEQPESSAVEETLPAEGTNSPTNLSTLSASGPTVPTGLANPVESVDTSHEAEAGESRVDGEGAGQARSEPVEGMKEEVIEERAGDVSGDHDMDDPSIPIAVTPGLASNTEGEPIAVEDGSRLGEGMGSGAIIADAGIGNDTGREDEAVAVAKFSGVIEDGAGNRDEAATTNVEAVGEDVMDVDAEPVQKEEDVIVNLPPLQPQPPLLPLDGTSIVASPPALPTSFPNTISTGTQLTPIPTYPALIIPSKRSRSPTPSSSSSSSSSSTESISEPVKYPPGLTKFHHHPKVIALAKKLARERGMKLIVDERSVWRGSSSAKGKGKGTEKGKGKKKHKHRSEGKHGGAIGTGDGRRAMLLKLLDEHPSQKKAATPAPAPLPPSAPNSATLPGIGSPVPTATADSPGPSGGSILGGPVGSHGLFAGVKIEGNMKGIATAESSLPGSPVPAPATPVLAAAPIAAPTPVPATPLFGGARGRARGRGRGRWVGHIKGSGMPRSNASASAAASTGLDTPSKPTPTPKEPNTQISHGGGGELEGLLPPGVKYMDGRARLEWVRGVEEKRRREVGRGIGSTSWWNHLLIEARRERGPQWDINTQAWQVDKGSALYYQSVKSPPKTPKELPAELPQDSAMAVDPPNEKPVVDAVPRIRGTADLPTPMAGVVGTAPQIPSMTVPSSIHGYGTVDDRPRSSGNMGPPPPPMGMGLRQASDSLSQRHSVDPRGSATPQMLHRPSPAMMSASPAPGSQAGGSVLGMSSPSVQGNIPGPQQPQASYMPQGASMQFMQQQQQAQAQAHLQRLQQQAMAQGASSPMGPTGTPGNPQMAPPGANSQANPQMLMAQAQLQRQRELEMQRAIQQRDGNMAVPRVEPTPANPLGIDMSNPQMVAMMQQRLQAQQEQRRRMQQAMAMQARNGQLGQQGGGGLPAGMNLQHLANMARNGTLPQGMQLPGGLQPAQFQQLVQNQLQMNGGNVGQQGGGMQTGQFGAGGGPGGGGPHGSMMGQGMPGHRQV